MCAIAVAGAAIPTISIGAEADVPARYRSFFVKTADKKSLLAHLMNSAGFTSGEFGRSFTLVAGVSRYPNMVGRAADLKPAAEDVRKLVNYLQAYEAFDEIVVLTEENVTQDNLSFFLEKYFPKQLRSNPKSRFLFAYSGHGMTFEGRKGYLLTARASSLSDIDNSISLRTLKAMFAEIVDSGFHVLALLNACYSGEFARQAAAPIQAIPRKPGAHVITAGGSSELTWHDASVGSGSIFFEQVFQALDGRAAILSRNPSDAIITSDELATYLRKVIPSFTDDKQNPLVSDLSPSGSAGSFFFFNRGRPVEAKAVPAWDNERGVPFGVPSWQDDQKAAAPERTEAGPQQAVAPSMAPKPAPPAGTFAAMDAYRNASRQGTERAWRSFLGQATAGVFDAGALLEDAKQQLAKVANSTGPVQEPGSLEPPNVHFRDCSVCPEMLVVPRGTFRMGSQANDSDAEKAEQPQHTVTVGTPLAVSRFLITNSEWSQCEQDRRCRPRTADSPRMPARDMTWEQANEFVAWISWKTEKPYRLLSEAEWEYVYRGGTQTKYWWGSSPMPLLNMSTPNPWGFYMNQDTREWLEDCWNSSYVGAPSDGSAWVIGNCNERVVRGGQLALNSTLRSAYRDSRFLGSGATISFRVARAINEEK